MWSEAYKTAKANLDSAAGFYNDNVCVETDRGSVNVRIPIAGASVMDLRIWREEDVLRALSPYVTHAPRLLHVSQDPPFQVHEFIDGPVLNDVAPRGTPLPPHVINDVVEVLGQLSRLPYERLPPLPHDWPKDGDTIAFARRLTDLTQQVYDGHVDKYGRLYRALGVPQDPVEPAVEKWPVLSSRPLVCVHSDIHRKNMILHGGATVFLDWEFALWGDPVYDLAVHLHKMAYLPSEQQHALQLWAHELPETHIMGWERDVEAYLAHERIKSAIVDTVRYAQLFARATEAPESQDRLIDKLTAKLNHAYAYWEQRDLIDRASVGSALQQWEAERHRA